MTGHTISAPPSIALAWGLWRDAWKETYGADAEPYAPPFQRATGLGRPEPKYYARIDALSDEQVSK